MALSGCLQGCGQKENNGLKDIKDLKTKQYAIEGRQLYLQHCANCHQEDGTGLGRLIPPLAGADYLLEDTERTVKIIKYGISGEMTVNNLDYNQPMPANPKLSPLEIAQITTYIYNVWGNKKGLVTAGEVRDFLASPEGSQ
jgi:mono/diheme cytochrome c family protein